MNGPRLALTEYVVVARVPKTDVEIEHGRYVFEDQAARHCLRLWKSGADARVIERQQKEAP